MTPHERVMIALDHKNPDRPPIDCIISLEMEEKLREHLNIKDKEGLLNYLGIDFRWIMPSDYYIGPSELTPKEHLQALGKDIFGVMWKQASNKFTQYNELALSPLANAKTLKELKEYPWPSPDWYDFSSLKEDIKRLNEKDKYAILFVGGAWFETMWYLRGLDRLMLDLIDQPEIVEFLSFKVIEFYKERSMRAIEASDEQIDIVTSAGDFGSQIGMLISPEVWQKQLRQWCVELITPFKKIGLKTFYHSCGSIIPVIDDLIKMGLDILNPVQPKAVGMDAMNLKRKFGKRISFHGGIDVQELLPLGTPDKIEKEVTEVINILGKDGGYIVASAQNIQTDTPIENVIAMYRTAREYKY